MAILSEVKKIRRAHPFGCLGGDLCSGKIRCAGVLLCLGSLVCRLLARVPESNDVDGIVINAVHQFV